MGAGGRGEDVDAVVLEALADGRGDVGVLTRQQPVGALDDRDLGTEAAEHLGRLTADEASADHDELLGQRAHFEHRARGQVGRRIEPVDPGCGVAGAGVQEDPLGLDVDAADPQRSPTDEPALSLDKRQLSTVLDSTVGAGANRVDQLVLAVDDRTKIDGRLGDVNAKA